MTPMADEDVPAWRRNPPIAPPDPAAGRKLLPRAVGTPAEAPEQPEPMVVPTEESDEPAAEDAPVQVDEGASQAQTEPEEAADPAPKRRPGRKKS